ncbi:hypothetical protein GOODEAATRI_034213 [Goodea atripinnis]|uniref:Uncharacterized protein n=1 Tax=Goodea atripinnis TaxID=208336 RepID=A0ABV0N6G9_9TELE
MLCPSFSVSFSSFLACCLMSSFSLSGRLSCPFLLLVFHPSFLPSSAMSLFSFLYSLYYFSYLFPCLLALLEPSFLFLFGPYLHLSPFWVEAHWFDLEVS